MVVKASITCLLSQRGEVGMIRQVIGNVLAGLLSVVFRHSTFAAHAQHFFEIAIAPAIGVSAGNDDNGSLFDLGLIEAGRAQAPALLGSSHNDEAPWLHVVSAGRMQSSFKNLLQI